MTRTARPALLVALLATALALAGPAFHGRGAPAVAGLGAPVTAGFAPDDDEGGTATLREQLDAAARGYLDANVALEQSQRRQRELTTRLTTLEAELATRSDTVDEIASVAYRTGRLGAISALLGAESPDGFLDRAVALNAVAANENTAVRHLIDTRSRATQAKTEIDNEVRQQRQHLNLMAQRKKQAEQALAAANRTPDSRAGEGIPATTNPSQATPAPRNSNGSWPAESCSVDDPTTTGCLTPRTRHALQQTKAAGFTRYVSCYRSGGSGEHPKGRACDFAAQANGFGGPATGGDRTYGNNLAAFYIANANRLGVLYVIWYRQIWLPSSGWRAYSGSGSPSAEHTNHVHLSVY